MQDKQQSLRQADNDGSSTPDNNATVPFKEWRLIRHKTVEDTTGNNRIGAGFWGIWASFLVHLDGKFGHDSLLDGWWEHKDAVAVQH